MFFLDTKKGEMHMLTKNGIDFPEGDNWGLTVGIMPEAVASVDDLPTFAEEIAQKVRMDEGVSGLSVSSANGVVCVFADECETLKKFCERFSSEMRGKIKDLQERPTMRRHGTASGETHSGEVRELCLGPFVLTFPGKSAGLHENDIFKWFSRDV